MFIFFYKRLNCIYHVGILVLITVKTQYKLTRSMVNNTEFLVLPHQHHWFLLHIFNFSEVGKWSSSLCRSYTILFACLFYWFVFFIHHLIVIILTCIRRCTPTTNTYLHISIHIFLLTLYPTKFLLLLENATFISY